MIEIYNLKNNDKFLERYPDHLIICSQNNLGSPPLWYHMEAGKIPETYTQYFYEKLGLEKRDATRAVSFWNKTIDLGIEEKVLHKIFTINNCPVGLHRINQDEVLVLCKSIRKIEKPLFIYRGGYIWNILPNMRLENNHETKLFLKSKLGITTKSQMRIFLNNWNQMQEE